MYEVAVGIGDTMVVVMVVMVTFFGLAFKAVAPVDIGISHTPLSSNPIYPPSIYASLLFPSSFAKARFVAGVVCTTVCVANYGPVVTA